MKPINIFLKKEDTSEIPDDKTLLPETHVSYPANRKVTDKCAFYIFGIVLLVTLPLIIYTLSHSDINRLKGYDKCGNICGQTNNEDYRYDCTGRDQTNASHFDYGSRECEEFASYMNRYEYRNKLRLDVPHYIKQFTLATLLPLGLTLLMVILFRYATPVVVYGIFFISWAYFGVLMYFSAVLSYYFSFLPFSILVPLLLMALCLLIFKWNRVRFSVVLFREAGKALSDIKSVYFLPMVNLLLLLTLLAVSIILLFHMTTAGILQEIRYYEFRLDFIPNGWMIAGIIFTIITTLWLIQIVIGHQTMAVSGAVSQWYNSRSPVPSNASTTLKYHLGTVIIGCVVNALLLLPQSFFGVLSQFSVLKGMAEWFLRRLNGFSYSYVVTAAHGKPFLQSSKKTMELLDMKIADTVAIRSIGTFVIYLVQFFVVWVSTSVVIFVVDDSYSYHDWSRVYLTLAICYVCFNTILEPVKTAYHTIFLCACQEILNEGDVHYSKSIKQHLTDSSEYFEKKVRKVDQPIPLATTFGVV